MIIQHDPCEVNKMREKKEEEDPDLKEFEDLINPFAKSPKGSEIDKDFEPKDPGWPYPDQDWGFGTTR